MKASYSSKKGVARNLLFFLLLFFMLPSMAIAQSTVRGIVTDDNGEPLPGVVIKAYGSDGGRPTGHRLLLVPISMAVLPLKRARVMC